MTFAVIYVISDDDLSLSFYHNKWKMYYQYPISSLKITFFYVKYWLNINVPKLAVFGMIGKKCMFMQSFNYALYFQEWTTMLFYCLGRYGVAIINELQSCSQYDDSLLIIERKLYTDLRIPVEKLAKILDMFKNCLTSWKCKMPMSTWFTANIHHLQNIW